MALRVNGETIEEKDILREIETLRPHYEQAFPDQPEQEREEQMREWSRENLIERALLRQAALRDAREIPVEAVQEAYQEMARRYETREDFLEDAGLTEAEVKKAVETQMRIRRHVDELVEHGPAPSEEDIHYFYEDEKERFTIPEMVHAAHIVKHVSPGDDVDTIRREMDLILAKARSGKKFADIAKTRSDCSDNGGDLGFFPRGQMVPAFEDMVFKLKVGEISDVFETEFGYHIATVLERRPAAPAPLDRVRETIVEELSQRFAQKAVEDFVDAERLKATIVEE